MSNPCSTCRFYVPRLNGAPVGPGECHVYPPTMVVQVAGGRTAAPVSIPATPVWPAVVDDDWCGQWSAIV